MEKFAKVKFVGNQQEYIAGKACDEWQFCRDCLQHSNCALERRFLFINGKEYKAYFLDYCQGVCDVLEVRAENDEILSFVPISDFEIVFDEHKILNNKQAIVRCVNAENYMDLHVGKDYVALKMHPKKPYIYVLDDSGDCYYYPKGNFIIVEDKERILTK